MSTVSHQYDRVIEGKNEVVSDWYIIRCPLGWTLGGSDLKLVFLLVFYLCKNIVYIEEIYFDFYLSLRFIDIDNFHCYVTAENT